MIQNIYQRTVERYRKGQIETPKQLLADRRGDRPLTAAKVLLERGLVTAGCKPKLRSLLGGLLRDHDNSRMRRK